jgi:transposase-like protein
MSTPTPRTDAEEYPEGEGQSFQVVSADFARTLERELTAERDELRAEMERCNDIINRASVQFFHDGTDGKQPQKCLQF